MYPFDYLKHSFQQMIEQRKRALRVAEGNLLASSSVHHLLIAMNSKARSTSENAMKKPNKVLLIISLAVLWSVYIKTHWICYISALGSSFTLYFLFKAYS